MNKLQFKTAKGITFSLLCLLQFLKQLGLHAFKLLSFSFVIRDLVLELRSLVIDIGASIGDLLANIIVLTH